VHAIELRDIRVVLVIEESNFSLTQLDCFTSTPAFSGYLLCSRRRRGRVSCLFDLTHYTRSLDVRHSKTTTSRGNGRTRTNDGSKRMCRLLLVVNRLFGNSCCDAETLGYVKKASTSHCKSNWKRHKPISKSAQQQASGCHCLHNLRFTTKAFALAVGLGHRREVYRAHE